jgi:hypothetical protein
MFINGNQDKCQTSIDYLKSKIRNHFGPEEQLFFPDDLTEYKNNYDANEVVNIFLFGSFHRSLMESWSWKFEKIRLFVLCESVKKCLVELWQIPSASICVFPRTLLDAHSTSNFVRPNLNKASLFYAGRINEDKNIPLLLSTTYYLQKNYDLNLGLHLIGPQDNTPKLICGEVADKSCFDISHYLSQYDWKIDPVVFPEVGPGQWVNYAPKENPIFISLSTSMFEDFGVSVSQAKAENWPMILSDWGGHREVSGVSCLKVPYHYLCQSKEYDLKGKMLASYLIENQFNFIDDKKEILSPPEVMEQTKLNHCVAKTFDNFGPELFCLSRNNWPEFFQTHRGIKFVSEHRASFMSELKHYDVLITNDFYNNEKTNKRINSYDFKKSPIVLNIYELLASKNMKLFLKADCVYSTFKKQYCDQLPVHYRSILRRRDVEFI